MGNEEIKTRENILSCAKAEFLEKGFNNASLRNIVKSAGVTTGAFYGYFSNKEALFAAIVEPHAAAVMGMFMQTQTDFADLPEEEQPEHMSVESSICVDKIMDYMYEHFEEFKLIICCSDGTAYEHFVHNMVEVEVEYTYKFIEVLRRLGNNIPQIDRQLCHILASGMFSGIFETIAHDMPKEQAKSYVKSLREFYVAGWERLMGFPLDKKQSDVRLP